MQKMIWEGCFKLIERVKETQRKCQSGLIRRRATDKEFLLVNKIEKEN